nr:hypothetical protein [Tanacetum cinerariifolium]
SQPRRPPTPDRDWNKTLPATQGNAQLWISALAKQIDARSSFNELLDTPIDFSNFIMNRLGVDTLTPKLLAGPTYELMRGSCNSLTELEYHLEEVYKATTDQLNWVNPEGQQYPHNLLQPLPLIPDNRGRSVILFEHFINNDLEYLRGGNLKRLRIQDIEDMLLLLVQGKLSNLTVEERFAFNVSLRMFTRSVIIQRRVEDLQLGVESYQKRLNLTKPDTYRSDLKRRIQPTGFGQELKVDPQLVVDREMQHDGNKSNKRKRESEGLDESSNIDLSIKMRRLKMLLFKGKDAYGCIYRVKQYCKIEGLPQQEQQRAVLYVWKAMHYFGINVMRDELHSIRGMTPRTHEEEVRSSRSKRPRQHEIVEEDVLNQIGCDGEIDDMLRIRVRKAESDEEIFTSVACIRAFNINEPIYVELCHEFYSTYDLMKYVLMMN